MTIDLQRGADLFDSEADRPEIPLQAASDMVDAASCRREIRYPASLTVKLVEGL